MALTTAEHMALAVLKGDLLAARALADHLLDITVMDAVHIPPVRKVTTADVSRLRVIAYVNDNVEFDQDASTELQATLSAWVRGTSGPIMPLIGIDRIEVYELPPPVKVPSAIGLAVGDVLPYRCIDPKEHD